MKTLILLSVACGTFASCSVLVDSQYGLRLGTPAVRNREAALKDDAERAALHAEPTPSSVTYLTAASELYEVDETPPSVGMESRDGFDAPFEFVAVKHYPIVTEQSAEPEESTLAKDEHVVSDQRPASSKKSIPYWLEVALGTLGLLIGFGLILLSGFGIFLSLFAILWGEVAAGAVGLAISLIALVGGWLLVRYLLNNVLSFSLGDMSLGRGRALNIFLGIAALVILILLSA